MSFEARSVVLGSGGTSVTWVPCSRVWMPPNPRIDPCGRTVGSPP